MASTTSDRILLAARETGDTGDLSRVLEGAGYHINRVAPKALGIAELGTHDLVMAEDAWPIDQGIRSFSNLRNHGTNRFVPILFIARDPRARVAALDTGADACLVRPFTADELLAEVRALLRLKQFHDRLNQKSDEFHRANKRLHHAYQQIDEEMNLARRIQQSMLPRTLPVVPPIQFAVYYRPCGRVGGDFYDVFRLDEDTVGFYVADVMGHGIPAALLTIFLKKAVHAKEIFGQEYRLIPPAEVLERLNREMIDLALAENPFITMVYGLFDRRDNTVSFARAGHPHPLHLPRSGAAQLWKAHGTLLGVFDTAFTMQTHRLEPGDKVLLYTDGIETNQESGIQPGMERLLAAAEQHRSLPIREFVAQLSRNVFAQSGQTDDLTLLGMEVSQGESGTGSPLVASQAIPLK
jgi:sigma-B regulation protein RsbU (phosphoserine phosphatase)